MNFKKRLARLERRAEQIMDDPDGGDDELTRMFKAIGEKGLKKILREIDGQSRGLPIENGNKRERG
jgi:hypothetical protein